MSKKNLLKVIALGLIPLVLFGVFLLFKPDSQVDGELLGASILNKRQGGTGRTDADYAAGAMIWASSSNEKFEVTTIGSTGQVWEVLGTGELGWGTDGGGGGGSQIELKDVPGIYNTNVSSVSFDGGKFTIVASGTAGLVNLDWGTGGPASLSEAETVTGNWVNTANPWADNEVIDTLTVTGGVIGANSISGTQTTTGTLTIGDNGDSIIIDASNWDVSTTGIATFLQASTTASFEAITYASASFFQGSAFGGIDCNDATDKLFWSLGLFTCGTLTVADTSATGGTGIDINTNDFVFDATELEALTWGAGGNASNVWTHNLSAGDPTITWTASGASLSLGFEALTYMSSSKGFFTGLLTLNNGASFTGTYPKKRIFISSTGGTCLTTAGCTDPTQTETTTNDVNYFPAPFAATGGDDNWQATFTLPESYVDGATFIASIEWTGTTEASATVRWGIKGMCIGDDDTLDTAFGTAVTVDDDVTVTGDFQRTADTAAITFAGSPVGGDRCWIQVFRDEDNDDSTNNANLLGIWLTFNVDNLSSED